MSRSEIRSRLEGRSIAIVGSGPGALGNPPGLVDSFDLVLRVNNYRLTRSTGRRTDIFYSFFGRSIKKTSAELKADGVTLCMCKCPDAHAIESAWHRERGKMIGVDFRWIYRLRASWWFCDVYVPPLTEFLASFELLGRHIPTTGFSAILAVLEHKPRQVFLTGFDFFRSGVHNVNERWRPGDPSDPIGHVPEIEAAWLAANLDKFAIATDARLGALLKSVPA